MHPNPLNPEPYTHGGRTRELSQMMLKTLLESGMRAGDKLPTEQEMTAQFQVSRPTLRQALKVLEFSGLIESAPRRGTVLKVADSRALGSIFAAHVALSGPDRPGDLKALAEARWLLERSVAALVVTRHTEADLAALVEAEEKYAEGVKRADDSAVLAADAAFHHAYVAAAHNPVISALRAVIDGYFDAVYSDPRELGDVDAWRAQELRTLDEHRRLREFIACRDTESLLALLDKHLQRTITRAEELETRNPKPRRTPR